MRLRVCLLTEIKRYKSAIRIRIRIKIKHIRTQKASDVNTSKDDLDLLGDDGDAFSGSHADLEGAVENLFSSPPRPQPLTFQIFVIKDSTKCPTHPRHWIAE